MLIKNPWLAAAMLCLIVTAAPPAEGGEAESTRAVWDRHVASALAGDVDAVMQDFTGESVILTTTGRHEGRAAIRRFVEGFLADLSPDVAATIVVNAESVQGGFVMSNFTIEAWSRTVHDTALIENGKIMVLTTVDYPAE